MPLFQHSNFLAFETQQQQSFLEKFIQSRWSSLRESLTVASTGLSTWSTYIQSLFPSPTAHSNTTGFDSIKELFLENPVAALTTAAVAFLAAGFLFRKRLMSGYSGYRSELGDRRLPAGRQSPYTSFHASRTGNLSDYVEYVPSGYEQHYTNNHDYHRPSTARPHQHASDAEEHPDVMNLRYKGTSYELLFIPYAISDGKLYIQDIRFFAAEKLRTNPNQVQMSYKGQRLTDDSRKAKDYGLKQNSEVTVVITESEAESVDSYSGSDTDNGSAVSHNREGHHRRHHHHRVNEPHRPRPRGQSSARSRPEIIIPEAAASSAFLHPSSATAGVARPPRPSERSSGDSLNTSNDSRLPRHERAPSHSQNPSPAPPSHRHSTPLPTTTMPTATSSAPAYPQPTTGMAPPAAPHSNNPTDQLNALILTFQTAYRMPCEAFIANPPEDPAAREKEYKRLSEGVLVKVVLKADEIETQGDLELRRVRKRLVEDANALLKELDGVRKA